MRKLFVVVAVVVGLVGCSTYRIPDYEIDTEKAARLSGLTNKIAVKSTIASFNDDGSVFCRGAGPVKSLTKKTFTEYITDALKQELQFRGIFNDDSETTFSIQLTKTDMSTTMGATNWYIDSVCSVDEESFTISTVYNDRSSFNGWSACNNIALYFEKAVRKHIEQIFANPVFRGKVNWTEASNEPLPDIPARLRQLEQLRVDGLITDDEYKIKRKAIIDSI